jgi:lipopolysaccharide transport system ATP-binding protein
MSSEIAIKVENLTKCYQIYTKPQDRIKQSIYPRLQRLAGKQSKEYFSEFWALKDCSFEVRRGECVGIIGRNGSGKSTLLQIICDTLNPTSGSVKTYGRVAALLELGSGFNPEFTGRENVYMNAAILGLTKEETDSRFEDILTFADIGQFIDQPVKIYSSGMMLRLAFAVIAHVDADILIIDEALAVGDTIFIQKCMRFIENFKQNKTLLFVSHDSGAIAKIASKGIWLKQGKLQFIGNTSEALDNYHADSIIDKDTKIFKREATHKNVNLLSNDLVKMNQMTEESINAGQGKASIISTFFSVDKAPKKNFSGGEYVHLNYLIKANETISGLLVGFSIKDKLGQKIIEANNTPFEDKQSIHLKENELLNVNFSFIMPTLKSGEYSIDLAIAEGNKVNYVHQSWLYDAIQIQMTPYDEVTGLIKLEIDSFNWQLSD